MKKLWLLGLTFLLCLSMITPIKAAEELQDDGQYHIVNVTKDGTYELINDVDTYAQAKVLHTLLQKKYDNLGITYGTTFLTIEQGVVVFDKANDCSVNVDYTNDVNQEDGYTNGCYGADAAFLENDIQDGKVKFLLSGVVGWVSSDKVSILPIEKVKKSTSYTVENGYLYHHIQSNIDADAYDNRITLAIAPAYLKEGVTYYGYDGHYFYDDYSKMIEDYRKEVRSNAVNAKEPFYNYFQYLSHRTSSSYDEEALQTYFKEELAINATISSFYDKDNYIHDILTQSLLPNAISSFLQYQDQYGANALLMLSLSMNETANGKSLLAFTRNNLFGHAAFDSDVEKNASRYQSINASVYSHAVHYISDSYLNPNKFHYHGGFLGDKSAGMNVQYASDPYWGEKAAQYAFLMDEALGKKDWNRYCLGISQNKEVQLYETASKQSNVVYTVKKQGTFSFVLLEKTTNKEGTWYLVQSDPSLDDKKKQKETGTYVFTDSYAYLPAEAIDHVINEQQLDVKNYIPITFDANGGSFYPEEKSVTLFVEAGRIPSVSTPIKDHALFDGWDSKLKAADEKKTYAATYLEVEDITLSSKPVTEYAYGDILDATGGMLSVNFKNKEHQEVPVTSEMISGYQSEREGKQTLTITYAGCTTTYEINVSKKRQEINDQLSAEASQIIKNFSDKTDLNEEALSQLKQLKTSMIGAQVNTFNSSQIRALDTIFQQNLSPSLSVIIKDDTYDLSVSGLSLALQEEESFLNHFFPKTIVLQVTDSLSKKEEALAEKVATANFTQVESGFKLSGKDDLGGFQASSELLFSIKKPEESEHKQYRVYYIEGEDVYQLATSQTETRIVFQSEKIGSYVLVSKTNTDLSQGEDIVENNTIASNGINYINRYLVLPASILILILILGIGGHFYLRKKGLRFKFHRKKKKENKQ